VAKVNPYDEGYTARVDQKHVDDCPYRRGTTRWEDWIEGWRDAGSDFPIRMSRGKNQEKAERE
jgi:ribosome modulation factor